MRQRRGLLRLGMMVSVVVLAAYGSAQAIGDGVGRAWSRRAEPAAKLMSERGMRPVQAGGIDVQVPKSDKAEGVFDSLTPAQVEAMLKDMGKQPESLKTEKGQPVFRVQMGDLKVLMFLYNKEKDGEGYLSASLGCGFKMETKPTLQTINKWNFDKRFTKAYVNEEGNPRLEMDMVFTGTTVKNIKQYIDIYESSLKNFTQAIGF